MIEKNSLNGNGNGIMIMTAMWCDGGRRRDCDGGDGGGGGGMM